MHGWRPPKTQWGEFFTIFVHILNAKNDDFLYKNWFLWGEFLRQHYQWGELHMTYLFVGYEEIAKLKEELHASQMREKDTKIQFLQYQMQQQAMLTQQCLDSLKFGKARKVKLLLKCKLSRSPKRKRRRRMFWKISLIHNWNSTNLLKSINFW